MNSRVQSTPATVLIVDDEEAVRNIAKLTLERSGFLVLLAKDGEEAVEVFRSNVEEVDAVLADMSLPGMGGAEICKQIHKFAAHVPILLSSGYDQSLQVESYQGEGSVTFLPKPYRPVELVDTLKKVLAQVKRVSSPFGVESPDGPVER